MKTRPKKISPRNLPTRLPLTFTLVLWLLLDRFDVPAVAEGGIWTLIVLLWVSSIIEWARENWVDIFDQDKEP